MKNVVYQYESIKLVVNNQIIFNKNFDTAEMLRVG